MSETLFDKYGGFETFSAVFNNFYRKVLDSEKIAHYFEGINIERLISHQTNFLARVLGGPDKYNGRNLAEAHKGMNITLPDFVEVAELLEESLEEEGVEAQDIKLIIKTVAELQDQIVGH